MRSDILRTATLYLLPLMMLFSVFLLYRGHNDPGGGFVGGLVAAASFSLYTIAFGPGEARRALRAHPRVLVGAGLLTAAAAGFLGMLSGGGFLRGLWLPFSIPALGKLGTPLLFDAGVYLVVFGVTLTIVYSLAEE